LSGRNWHGKTTQSWVMGVAGFEVTTHGRF